MLNEHASASHVLTNTEECVRHAVVGRQGRDGRDGRRDGDGETVPDPNGGETSTARLIPTKQGRRDDAGPKRHEEDEDEDTPTCTHTTATTTEVAELRVEKQKTKERSAESKSHNQC